MNNNTQLKDDLALAYRICDHLGLSDLTYTHLSVRSEEHDSFYIYPFGLLFEEVKAESLMKVQLDGTVLEGKEAQYNKTGYVIHGSVYQHRDTIKAIFHLHTPSIVAVSCFEEGLLFLSQWALHFVDQINYHSYDSLALDPQHDGDRIAADLGLKNILMMRHHGALIGGSTLQECLFFAYHLEQACKTQCQMGIHQQLRLMTIPQDIARKTNAALLSFEERLGERDFAALKRVLKA